MGWAGYPEMALSRARRGAEYMAGLNNGVALLREITATGHRASNSRRAKCGVGEVVTGYLRRTNISIFARGPIKEEPIQPVMPTTTAVANADQNPPGIWKPGSIAATSPTMAVFTTS